MDEEWSEEKTVNRFESEYGGESTSKHRNISRIVSTRRTAAQR